MKTADLHLKEFVKSYEILPSSLEEKTKILKEIYKNCDDIVFHPFSSEQSAYLLIFVSGLSDQEKIHEHIIKPIQNTRIVSPDLASTISHVTNITNAKLLSNTLQIIDEIADGNTILFNAIENQAVSYRISSYEKRSIEEPQAESVVIGSREGFIESVNTNLSLVRRKIKTPSLKMSSVVIGSYSHTSIYISYIVGIANLQIVEDVKERLSMIDVDAILSTASIEEALESNWSSLFPQVQYSERPEVVAAALLEGRVAIFIDGVPFVLMVPVTLFTLLQSPEDYTERFINGTLSRWLRYLFLMVAVLAPSAYIAILTFHQEMIPTTLLLRIAQSREEIPFPAFLEALLMQVIFEVLREAGIRLPKQMGSTVSIVGTLVIGQAAIQAGLVSAPMVMIVAITGISSFLLPQYPISIVLRWIPFPIMFLSGMLGLVGLMLGVLIIASHLCSLKSFGISYLAPLTPNDSSLFRDVLIRVPLKYMKKRPTIYSSINPNRRNEGK
ncbi:spore germination protein [Psychrobacillus sp. FSL H8-0510]|uniref:spore germination protein n=1 Tax=Psychrobacillus sp. FSL H8-0510 TaxID=2921394 RepID=UPI0030F8394C